MPKRLLIHYHPYQPEIITWLIVDAENQVIDGPHETPWTDLSPSQNSHAATILISTQALLIKKTTLPSKKHSELIQAIPYHLEDKLINELDDLDFSFKAMGHEQIVCVADKYTIEQLLSHCRAAHLKLEAIIPDIYGIAYQEKTIHVLLYGEQAIVRNDLYTGFVCRQNQLLNFLTLACNESETVITDIIIEDFSSQSFSMTDEHSLHLQCNVTINQHNNEYLTELLLQYPKQFYFNLQKKSYYLAAKQPLIKKLWLASTAAISLSLVILFSSSVYQHYQYTQLNQQLEKTIANIYQQFFPAATAVISPRQRIEQLIASEYQQVGQTNALNLLGQIAPIIGQLTNIQITEIRYQNAVMHLTVKSDSFNQLDVLKTQFITANINAEQKHISQKEQQIFAEFEVIL